MVAFSIIIPHFNGELILENCISSLEKAAGQFEIIVVDNGSTDHSIIAVKNKHPEVTIVNSDSNLGYAGGCSYGATFAKYDYLIFLNNDTEVHPDWLIELEKTIVNHPHATIFQPKILSLQSMKKQERIFDYAGGAGGKMDFLGYPFALGRIMYHVETDNNQYDASQAIFWASGTALVIKSDLAKQLDFFDDLYFAHMEEIDMCWRAMQLGYHVQSSPLAEVYHLGGQTLAFGNPEKIYLNHRNNWMLVFKNAPLVYFLLILLPRICIDLIAMAYYTIEKGWLGFVILPRAYGWLLKNLPLLIQKRTEWLKMRRNMNSGYQFFHILKQFHLIPVIIQFPFKRHV